MTTGEKITLLRKENNYTQEQLAQILDVSRQSVSKWELDQAFPETKMLIQMSELFHCSVDYLLKQDVIDRNVTGIKEKMEESIRRGFVHNVQFEYKSKKTVWGKPLVHINLGIGKVADGIISIGIIAKGIVSIGVLSLGVISIGVFALGLLSLASFALGVISLGAISVGLLSLGAIAIGVVAIGGIALGEFSIGGLAVAKYIAYGDRASAMIAIGDTSANGQNYSFSVNSITTEEFDAACKDIIPSYLKWLIPFVRNIL